MLQQCLHMSPKSLLYDVFHNGALASTKIVLLPKTVVILVK
jgi:hypothetical protein